MHQLSLRFESRDAPPAPRCQLRRRPGATLHTIHPTRLSVTEEGGAAQRRPKVER
jgi:hypothetical protein